MILIITDSVAHTSPVGERLGECLVRGRRATKVNSLSLLSCPPAPGGPRHSGLQPPPHAGPQQRPPFMPRAQSGPFTGVPWASRPPAAPRASPLVAPAARQAWGPAHGRAAGLRAPARFFSHGWHSPPTSDWPRPPAAPLDWRARPPGGRGRGLSQRAPIGPCGARVGGAFPAGPPPVLPQAEASGRPWKPVSAGGPGARGRRRSGTGPGAAGVWGRDRGPGGPARAAGEGR